MPAFNIRPNESKEVAKATFHRAEDYKTIRLKTSEEPVLLHRIHADKLIKKGLAEELKGIKMKEDIHPMTSTPIDDK